MLDTFRSENAQCMRNKVEVDGKSKYSIGNGRSGKAAGVDIESATPPVIYIWRKFQPNLAHNLGPHMERAASILPILQRRQLRPLVRRTGKIICWHAFLHLGLRNLFIQVELST